MANWEAIGATRENVVAIAVIGVLIYLAQQISQIGINARAWQISLLNQSYAVINDLIDVAPKGTFSSTRCSS
tara:strand:- start:4312 stop:4527 length:216 start_codon:yes stop_codon:yes gene_type:complete